jgi:N-acetyl-anhydromuramyl-L-alanine amidase AmpD
VPGRSGVFPVFPSWFDGLAATAGRLASLTWPAVAPYGARGSIGEVFDHPSGAVWAPAGDLNDPSGYLNAMLAAMNEYADQDDEQIFATRAPAPAVYADYLALNHSQGRAGHRPRAILLHITQSGSAAGTINWFKNPAAKVSAHYIVERNGVITALVREPDTAWINGVLVGPNTSIAVVERWVTEGINPNVETIGIECVGYSPAQPHPDRPDLSGYTEAQMGALAFLLPAIGQRWAIDLEPGTCFGHREVDNVNRRDCPGLTEGEWQVIWAMDAVEIETPDDAFNAWLDRHGDSALWAGLITGKRHWYGRDPQELCRTVGGRLLAYDGAKAIDATGWQMDEWQEASLASGQLTIF